MSDVLGVSISGLRVSQNAIRTTGHNIANANTEGYSRQTLDINSNQASVRGNFSIGNGSYTADIQRVVDNFVIGQIRADTSLSHELETYNEFIGQVDSLLANPTTGLTQGLESFFSALENVSDDPTSISARQLVITEAQTTSDRFTTLYSRLDSIQDNVSANIRAAANTINNYSEQIANINESLSDNFNNSATGLPNDLLDQRDEAIRRLSELVSVQVTPQESNMVNVSLPNGIQLVLGTSSAGIEVRANEFDVTQPEIHLSNQSINQPITDYFTGGEMGALLDFQTNVLKPSVNEMGRLALVLSEEINQLQQQGITVNNQFGENLFKDINTQNDTFLRVVASNKNTTDDQIMSLTISETANLTTSDYALSINGAGTAYSVLRLSDRQEVSSGALPALPTSITFDGLSLDITSGTFSADDEFILQPTRFGARDITVQSLLPEDLAMGSPVATNSNLSNQGSGVISAGEVLQLVDSSNQILPLFTNEGEFSPPLLVQFTTPTTYDVLDNSNPGNPVQLDPPIRNQAYVPGIQNTLFSTDPGQTTVVSSGDDIGLPAANTTNNGYAAEALTFTTTDPATGLSTDQVFNTVANASAKTTAASLSNLTGVTANASNYLELRDVNVSFSAPLQISLNGEDLVQYDGAAINAIVPDPALNNGEDFNDYLAQEINNNSNLQNVGIRAVSAYDADAPSDKFYVQIHSTQGDDLTIGLESTAGNSLIVNDGNNPNVAINASGLGTPDTLFVGGVIDVVMDSDVVMTTAPATSALFGDSTAADFAQSSFWGIQANIIGSPESGDRFELDFNSDAASDNRNALLMSGLRNEKVIGGEAATLNTSYSSLIETVGIKANSAAENYQSAKTVLEQTTNLRDSVSGVNLDEEAANLIRYEQLYTANARVINVARELFDQLLNSF